MPNHYPELFLFRCIVLKIVIWHIFWEILKTNHTLWKNTTFNSSLGLTKGMATEKKYPCHMLRASKNSISIFMRTIIFLYCSTILIFSMFVSYVIIKFLCCYAIYVSFFLQNCVMYMNKYIFWLGNYGETMEIGLAGNLVILFAIQIFNRF